MAGRKERKIVENYEMSRLGYMLPRCRVEFYNRGECCRIVEISTT